MFGHKSKSNQAVYKKTLCALGVPVEPEAETPGSLTGKPHARFFRFE